jgi:hypothetical protein
MMLSDSGRSSPGDHHNPRLPPVIKKSVAALSASPMGTPRDGFC